MKQVMDPPHIQLAVLSREYVLSRSIHAVANLGIADHMSDKPITVKKLAQLTSTVPELLERVLNFLTVYGLFQKTAEGYALTPLSYPLRQDNECSIKDILSMVDESWWEAFAHLETELKTGTPGFEHQHGTDFFAHLNADSNRKEKFQKGLAKLSSFDDEAIVQAFNFKQFRTLINIGDNKEHLSATLEKHVPHLSITSFPFKNEINNLPQADAYLLKGVLHDFNDEKIKRILSECHHQMKDNASLIIAEQVMPNDDYPHTNKTMDIIMMVLVGGRQRPLSDWQEVIESVGFHLNSSVQTKGVFTVMEFVRV